MDSYTVRIEAQAYLDPQADGEALLDAMDEDMEVGVAVNEAAKAVACTFTLPAASARDAHDEALEQWEAAWEVAFPDAPPTRRLIITSEPVTARAGAPV